MPPNQDCPVCGQRIEDWHVEWYLTEWPALHNGMAAMDCPVCRQPVGLQQGNVGPAPPGVPVVRRSVAKAAAWAASQALHAGGTLQGYTSSAGAGRQYTGYWTAREIRQADADEQAKQQGP